MGNKLLMCTVEFISALLILLFVYSALSKITAHDSFVFALQQSALVQQFSRMVSITVPAVEIIASLLIFVPRWRQTGLLFAALLMTAFSLYIGYMLAYTSHLPCSCGGVLSQMTWRQHLIFNIAFMLLAFLGWAMEKRNKDFIAINRKSRIPV